MRIIKIGVIFDQEIVVGGGYQQSINAAIIASKLPSSIAECKFFTTIRANTETLPDYGIYPIYIGLSVYEKLLTYFRRSLIKTRLYSYFQKISKLSPFEKKLLSKKLDLIYFISPNDFAQDLENLNFIITVWDLSHRDDPEFPEIRSNRAIENRDDFYTQNLPRAIAILVDSEFGRLNAIRRYGLDSCRVKVMPFEASFATRNQEIQLQDASINISSKYNLQTPYIFYPAQFWSHKNHVYIIDGLLALEELYGYKIGAIFSGSDKGNLNHVKEYALNSGISERIKFIGFVDNREIPYLYTQSLALVMPSYFGPTNLPPLEAFNLGVPVLYSNKEGLRDQVGNAAVLIDLDNHESLASGLRKLIDDDEFRNELISRGHSRLKELNSINRIEILETIVKEFRSKRASWK